MTKKEPDSMRSRRRRADRISPFEQSRALAPAISHMLVFSVPAERDRGGGVGWGTGALNRTDCRRCWRLTRPNLPAICATPCSYATIPAVRPPNERWPPPGGHSSLSPPASAVEIAVAAQKSVLPRPRHRVRGGGVGASLELLSWRSRRTKQKGIMAKRALKVGPSEAAVLWGLGRRDRARLAPFIGMPVRRQRPRPRACSSTSNHRRGAVNACRRAASAWTVEIGLKKTTLIRHIYPASPAGLTGRPPQRFPR